MRRKCNGARCLQSSRARRVFVRSSRDQRRLCVAHHGGCVQSHSATRSLGFACVFSAVHSRSCKRRPLVAAKNSRTTYRFGIHAGSARVSCASNSYGEPCRMLLDVLAEARSNNPTMAIWAWRDQSDMSVAEELAVANTYRHRRRERASSSSNAPECYASPRSIGVLCRNSGCDGGPVGLGV